MSDNNNTRLDANETIIFNNQLEKVKSKAYMKEYPSLDVRQFLPTIAGGADWAESISYEEFENVGVADWLSNYGNDVNRADVKGQKHTIYPKPLAVGYGYNQQEVKAAIHAGKPLVQKRANSAKEAWKLKERDIAMFARGRATEDAGVRGFVYGTGITVSNAPTGGWSTATATQMIADTSFLINNVKTITNDVEDPKDVLMGTTSMGYLSTTQLPGTSVTALTFLKQNFPTVTFKSTYLLNSVDPKPSTPTVAGATTIMIAYDNNEDKLSFEVPMDWTQEAPERKGFQHTIDTHGRIAGVILYRPLSIHIVEGL